MREYTWQGIHFQRGDRIRIPKGITVTGTFPGGKRTTKRMSVAEVFYVTSTYNEQEGKEGPAKVVWGGHKGYWNEASYLDVEKIEEPS